MGRALYQAHDNYISLLRTPFNLNLIFVTTKHGPLRHGVLLCDLG
jgi:hypothetical protein